MSHMTRRAFLMTALFTLLALVSLGGCVPVDDGSPRIASLTITPDTINENSTGMTDQFFEITIVTENFTEPLESAQVFIQELNREAAFTNAPEITGDTIVIRRVPFAWFSGVEAGTHAISATVYSVDDLQSATELNLATVTVTQ